MTLPNEKLRAFKNARLFLLDLLDRQKTPRVPMEIRRAARYALKHYMAEYELDKLAELAPDLLIGDGIKKGNK